MTDLIEKCYGIIATCSNFEQLETCLTMVNSMYEQRQISAMEASGLLGGISVIKKRISVLHEQHKSAVIAMPPPHLQNEDKTPVLESSAELAEPQAFSVSTIKPFDNTIAA